MASTTFEFLTVRNKKAYHKAYHHLNLKASRKQSKMHTGPPVNFMSCTFPPNVSRYYTIVGGIIPIEHIPPARDGALFVFCADVRPLQ